MLAWQVQINLPKVNKKLLLSPIPLLVIAILVMVSSRSAQALSISDIIDGIKNVFSQGSQNNNLSVTSKITLVPEGDLNKNGQIDAGDTVRFTYTITNPTNNSYKQLDLKTSVDTKKLNGITNVQGVLSLDQNKDTVTIPYLTIDPNQVRTVSFDAKVNLYKDNDQSLGTVPELVAEGGISLLKAQKEEVKAHKLDAATFNKLVHISP